MNETCSIMVQIADRAWTLEALHCACTMARKLSAKIALVKMIPVQHPGWLGTELGYMSFTKQDQADFADYQATIEDYGLEFTPVLFQYDSLMEAVAQAAEHVNAQIVFAQLPESILPLWQKYQRWSLNRQLVRQQRRLIQHPMNEIESMILIHAALPEINTL